MSTAWQCAKEHIHQAQENQQKYYNKTAHELNLNPGDTVYKHNPVVKPGLT